MLQPTPGRSLTFWDPGEKQATEKEAANISKTSKTYLRIHKRVVFQNAFVLFFIYYTE